MPGCLASGHCHIQAISFRDRTIDAVVPLERRFQFLLLLGFDPSSCLTSPLVSETQLRLELRSAACQGLRSFTLRAVRRTLSIPAPGGGEVHIRTHPIGVNFADIYHRSGTPHPLVVGDPPIIVGNEAVASVVAVGPDVHEFKAGDKIATCQPPIGAYAEERLYPVEKLIETPGDLGLTDQELASVLIKGLTAQFLLHETYQVKPGETVLIHAAAVGMGHILCPWARHLGATVIGTVST
jgi:D-arabinose 1-dehydrogenase-like Zn-dependent alcohol dehydrogenase